MSKKIMFITLSSIFTLIVIINLQGIDLNAASFYPDYIKDESLAEEILMETNMYPTIETEVSQEDFATDVKDVTSLSINSLDIKDFSGLENFSNLENLQILNIDESITTIPEEVNTLTKLKTLSFTQSGLTNISNLDNLTNLEYLNLGLNNITKIEGLENLTNLVQLKIDDNKLDQIEGLNTLTNLTSLSLSNNNISKIEGLDTLVNLTKLNLNDNQISKLEGLDTLVNLENLMLRYNKIEKIEGLDNLNSLTYLYLWENNISKIEGLDALINLETLELTENKITKIEGLEDLANLNTLVLSENNISKIEGLDNIEDLRRLDLSENNISEIEGLDNITNLESLDLSQNNIINLNEQLPQLESLIDSSSFTHLSVKLYNQQYTQYLPKSDTYQEVFQQTNCPDTTCNIDFNNYLIDGSGLTKFIDQEDLNENNTYSIETTIPSYSYRKVIYSIDITIKTQEEITAQSSSDFITDASKSEEELLEKLQAQSTDYQGIDNSENIFISDLDNYNYSQPEVNTYNIEVSFTNENDYTYSTTVEYQVKFSNSVINSDDAVVNMQDAPKDEMQMYETLELGGTDRFGNEVTPEDIVNYDVEIENMDGYDFNNVKEGTYDITVMATTVTGEEITTTSTLEVMNEENIQRTQEPTEITEEPKTTQEPTNIKETGLQTNIITILLLTMLVAVISIKRIIA